MTIQTFEFLSAKGNWKIINLSHALDEHSEKKIVKQYFFLFSRKLSMFPSSVSIVLNFLDISNTLQ